MQKCHLGPSREGRGEAEFCIQKNTRIVSLGTCPSPKSTPSSICKARNPRLKTNLHTTILPQRQDPHRLQFLEPGHLFATVGVFCNRPGSNKPQTAFGSFHTQHMSLQWSQNEEACFSLTGTLDDFAREIWEVDTIGSHGSKNVWVATPVPG